MKKLDPNILLRPAQPVKLLYLPKMSLTDLAGVIGEAQAAVAVDTGLGHLAAAMAVPAVSLYGPTSPLKVGAYGAGQKHLTINDSTLGKQQKKNHEIFDLMTPDIVWQALKVQIEEHQNSD